MILCAHNVGKTVHQSQVAILCSTPFSYTFAHRPGNPVLVNGAIGYPEESVTLNNSLTVLSSIWLKFFTLHGVTDVSVFTLS